MTPPPTPFHILRTHHAPLSALSFNPSSTLLYAGDQDGYVSITDLRGRRVVRYWKAHEGGVLGVEEWEGRHGRDNVIHIYERVPRLRLSLAGSSSAGTSPAIWKSLTTNSLNFCRFALLPIPRSLKRREHSSRSPDETGNEPGAHASASASAEALLAVPSLLDSELADVYHLPSMRRVHAAVNVPDPGRTKRDVEAASAGSTSTSKTRSGLIMSLHLRFVRGGDPEGGEGMTTLGRRKRRLGLMLAIGFEDGRVELWRCPEKGEGEKEGEGRAGARAGAGANPVTGSIIPMSQAKEHGGERGTGSWRIFSDGKAAVGPRVWELVWQGKGHNEAVMAMTVDRGMTRAYTVSADHLLIKYDLTRAASLASSGEPSGEAAQAESKTSGSTPTASSDSFAASPRPDTIISPFSTKQIGNASLALTSDERVVAVGGWDGNSRLFSAASGKPLGKLAYHRDTVHVLAFPRAWAEGLDEDCGDADEEDEGEAVGRVHPVEVEISEQSDGGASRSVVETLEMEEVDSEDEDWDEGAGAGAGGTGAAAVRRWMASGGKDTRIALWELMDFGAGQA